jgi:hypothetical protein
MAALSTIALAALTGASGLSSFLAGRKQADATQAQGDYEASLLEQNAGLAQQQAADATARGALAEQQIRGQTRQTVGAQRVGLAGQGIDTNVGSAADVQAETSSLGAFDAMTTRLNAARESWGYKVQATDYRNKAALTRAGARNMAGAQRTGAYGTLLTTAASLAGQAKEWRR